MGGGHWSPFRVKLELWILTSQIRALFHLPTVWGGKQDEKEKQRKNINQSALEWAGLTGGESRFQRRATLWVSCWYGELLFCHFFRWRQSTIIRCSWFLLFNLEDAFLLTMVFIARKVKRHWSCLCFFYTWCHKLVLEVDVCPKFEPLCVLFFCLHCFAFSLVLCWVGFFFQFLQEFWRYWI